MTSYKHKQNKTNMVMPKCRQGPAVERLIIIIIIIIDKTASVSET